MTTESGFEFEIEEDALDDMEFLEVLMKVQEDEKSQQIYLPKLCEVLLGAEGYKALKEHEKKKKGKVRISRVAKEFTEIMAAASDSKKK